MGYTTDFFGGFDLTNITPAQEEYINRFSISRRMKRDITKLRNPELGLINPKDDTPESIYGIEGEFYTGEDEIGVLDYNKPAKTQPGLWCQWVVNRQFTRLEWDGTEKFYNYIEWLHYLNDNFFKVWGVGLNGSVKWRGEDYGDSGTIVVENNEISVYED